MCREQFYILLDKAFNLMIENKLREDMDDSLLEKLLSVIKDGVNENIGFMEGMLNCTHGLPLAEKVALSLTDNKTKLSVSVKVFSLRLISLIFENESIFASQRNSIILQKFSESLNDNKISLLASSIQDAVLSCVFSFGKHPKGAVWIIQEKLLDYAFSSFCSSSYYVRKTAIQSFAEALSLWTSLEFAMLLPAAQQTIINNAIEQILTQIIVGIQLADDLNVNSCCILTLKKALEAESIRNLVCTKFNLIEDISNYLKNLSKNDILNESVLELVLAIYLRDPSIGSVVKESIEVLVAHHLFVPAINMALLYLSTSEELKPLSSNNLQLFFLPLQILNGRMPVDSKDSTFHFTSSACLTLKVELADKIQCVHIITSSINALSKLTCFMNTLALESVLNSIEVTVKGPTNEQSHSMSYICLENRNIHLAVLELFSCLLVETVYCKLNLESQLKLLEYMLCFLERPTFDSNITSEVLKLLKDQAPFIANYRLEIPPEMKDKLIMLLSRKLLDNKEPVVDSALHLAEQIITTKGNEVWKDAITNHSIHMIIWEIAIEGSNEGFVKASALRVIINACLNQYYWKDIKSTKNVDVVAVMNVLCRYFHHPDFFIQRESLSCIHKWFQSNEKELSEYNHKIFSILFCAVKSLDLELKLTALLMWQWLIDFSSVCDITQSCDVNSYMKILVSTGLVACISNAIEDYDDAVQFNAAKILLQFRQKLLSLGYTKDSLTIDDLHLKITSMTVDNSVINPISKAERDAGIETVLNISTSEHLTNIYCEALEESFQNSCHCQDFSNISETGAFSFKSFWNILWSDNLDLILTPLEKCPTVFSEYSLSLLDDVIAAEETELNHCVDDGLDCY